MNNPRKFIGSGVTSQLELAPLNLDHSIKPNWPWLRKVRKYWTVRCVNEEGCDVVICRCDDEQEACNIIMVLRKQMKDLEKQILKNRRILARLNKKS